MVYKTGLVSQALRYTHFYWNVTRWLQTLDKEELISLIGMGILAQNLNKETTTTKRPSGFGQLIQAFPGGLFGRKPKTLEEVWKFSKKNLILRDFLRFYVIILKTTNEKKEDEETELLPRFPPRQRPMPQPQIQLNNPTSDDSTTNNNSHNKASSDKVSLVRLGALWRSYLKFKKTRPLALSSQWKIFTTLSEKIQLINGNNQ